MRRFISFLSIFFFLSTQVGCGIQQKPITTHATFSEVSLEPDYTYQIEWVEHGVLKKLKIKGRMLEKTAKGLMVHQEKEPELIIPSAALQKFVGSKRVGSYAKTGALVGAIVLGLVGAIHMGSQSCEGPNGGYEDSDCPVLRGMLTVLEGGVGAAVGGLVGLGVGYAIPKNSKIIIAPQIAPEKQGVKAGLTLSVPF